jgi:hypothetical protein
MRRVDRHRVTALGMGFAFVQSNDLLERVDRIGMRDEVFNELMITQEAAYQIGLAIGARIATRPTMPTRSEEIDRLLSAALRPPRQHPRPLPDQSLMD